MSADKHRSRTRRIRLLRRAAPPWGILIHAEGGMAIANRDIQRLLREGMLEAKRFRHHSDYRWPAPKRFRSGPTGPGHGRVSRTHLLITEAGLAFLAQAD